MADGPGKRHSHEHPSVHQNFPGQYRELFRWLVAQRAAQDRLSHAASGRGPVEGAEIVVYKPHHQAAKDAYALSSYWEDCVGNGYGAAQACETLKRGRVSPGHHPRPCRLGGADLRQTGLAGCAGDRPVRILLPRQGGFVGFDPEFPASDQAPFTMHARNAVNFANIQTVDLGYAPTLWQRDTFPESFHPKLYVCHDGIRTDTLTPDAGGGARPRASRPSADPRRRGLTYVARNLEPVRGFHVFMRALPEILDARPEARAVIVGGNGTPTARPATIPAATAR
jgi:hypothetical protein